MAMSAGIHAIKEVGVIGSLELRSHSDQTEAEAAVDTEAQPGVQDIEAVTAVWVTSALVVAYILIWLTYLVEGIILGTQAALLPYVTSAFALHSLTPTVSILSSVIGGVTNLTIAKILDVFGRPQGYLTCIIVGTVGLIMMAASRQVETFAAASVFYTVGNNGLQYTLSVFVADTSSLRNRGLMQAFASSPNLITCWLAGPIASGFLGGPGWPWAFGTFSILVPAIGLPLFGLLLFHSIKAKKQNLIPQSNSGRTPLQSLLYYCREFDAVGLILLSAGVALFLLPFNLYTLQGQGWSSPLIISFLVFGVALITSFVIWERFFAPVTFLPYTLLRNRTVLGACILSATLFFTYSCWNAYFSSFLQVVNNLSVEKASYIIQTYTVGSVICSLGVGALIHYTGRFKPLCLYLGIPLSILGTGLLIYFRRPDVHVGWLAMCQLLISFAAGTVILCAEIAVMADTSHQQVAVVLAALSLFSGIGAAIGLTVAAAIWQGVFPARLAQYLPVEAAAELPAIYADLAAQLAYPVGSPARLAIQRAYGDAQKDLLFVGTAAWVLGALAVGMWKDIDVRGIKQVRGQVV